MLINVAYYYYNKQRFCLFKLYIGSVEISVVGDLRAFQPIYLGGNRRGNLHSKTPRRLAVTSSPEEQQRPAAQKTSSDQQPQGKQPQLPRSQPPQASHPSRGNKPCSALEKAPQAVGTSPAAPWRKHLKPWEPALQPLGRSTSSTGQAFNHER